MITYSQQLPGNRCLRNFGFSLIEIAIVLSIVGIVIGGVWEIAANIANNNKKNQLVKETIQIILNTKNLFAGGLGPNATNGFSNATGIRAGLFPPEMIVNGAVIDPFYRTPGDGFSNVGLGPGGVPRSIVLVIGNHGIPYDACINLVSQITTDSNFKNLGIVAVDVGGGTGSAGSSDASGNGTGAVNGEFTSQPTMAAISAACPSDNMGSYTGGAYVIITFKP